MYDVFISLLDSLYWEGYAENLSKENPELFNYELNEFLNNYLPWKR